MIHFVGAGSGAPDLITVRGQKFLREADVVIYAGSLVNPELLKETKPGCEILNSAYMTLDEVIRAMEKAEREGKMTVRLHTGDPLLLRRCIKSPCGTHAAWRIPVRDHHENGGADRSPGAGELPFPGGSPCDHGGILKHGTVVTDGKGTCGSRI